MRKLFWKRLKRLSWRRSRGPDSGACCGGLEVGRCGNDQHGCDMADLKMDSFRRNRLYVRHARCGCVFCVHLPVELSVLLSGNPKPAYSTCTDRLLFEKSLIHCSSYCEDATTMTSIAKWNLAMM